MGAALPSWLPAVWERSVTGRIEYKSAGLLRQVGARPVLGTFFDRAIDSSPRAPRIHLKPFCSICNRRHDFAYRCPASEDKR